MGQLTQDNRLISVSSPLGKDKLLLTSFQGNEYISDLFEFQLEVLSDDLAISPDSLIGKTVTVTIQNELKRTFNGYVCRFEFGEVKADNLRQYRLTVVPWLWFLSKTQNCRIFQEKTSKDIISQIFKDLGFADFVYKAKPGAKREYCVQYNESDLNFISRLLEEEGSAYYFTQDGDKHTLNIVDQKNSYDECAETNLGYSKGNQPNTQINEWQHISEFKTGKWTINDYNFKEPVKSQLVSTTSRSNFANSKSYEHYEYPGLYEVSKGDELVKKRMEAEEISLDTIQGASDCSSFYAGGKFKLKKHEAKSEQGNYILTSVGHAAYDASYFSGSEGQSGYSNQFMCIPAEVYYRPEQTHFQPVMYGPQSAVVTGPSGEEIYIDEHGRIKVQFIWDREGKKNENSSCYLRVAQAWAGNAWGGSFIPRIGQEVIVNFLDGNPDRPLVTGAVYNGDNKPPYKSKTQSGIKTRSTKGAAKDNYNELRFEDLKGSEEIYIQAEKDYKSLVKNDQTSEIKNNQTITIDKEQSITVKANRTLKVDKNIKTDADKIVITGKTSIEFKVGGSTIKLDSSGITIKGTKVAINGTMVEAKGSGMVTIKGGLTKIN